ncbi:major membrane immunogen (membrane-anchored lipoprotein) [Natranaerovirga pectinivora]|uniref:Major membrane immunogen (Membrane-anchored lipoprotein) n=1 Tax=Natranaerovirga pectinivora TaxID=682400 RepID=A0A4R3MN34_9FIRM|nr:FMN-binding protein [Natranaerovirga pectinivora]TCT14002.1 major membrane immunogen (membrane-anchored lipoprotein) [Natranaerovirga pectinivora]
MKKVLSILLLVVLALSLAGCSEKKPTAETFNLSKYADGIYFAQEDSFNERTGWKNVVTFEVKDGKFEWIDWNAANRNGGKDKKTTAADGEYGMAAVATQGEWHLQAEAAEAFLLETQNPYAVSYDAETGKTDEITGATITVSYFFELVQDALAKGPVGRGLWEDGTYYAEVDEFSNGYKYSARVTVINGYIVAANWDGVPENGDIGKKQASIDGNYGMVARGGASLEWHEQAALAEAHLLEIQDPTAIAFTDGVSDDISGATMKVNYFFELVDKALNN